MNELTSQEILDLARRTLNVEAEALQMMAQRLGDDFLSHLGDLTVCQHP